MRGQMTSSRDLRRERLAGNWGGASEHIGSRWEAIGMEALRDQVAAGMPWPHDNATVLKLVPLAELSGHFHDTYGQALTNIYACLELGIHTFDASVANGRSFATGDFAKEYATTTGNLKSAAQTQHAVVRAQVSAVGVVRATASEVELLVYLNQYRNHLQAGTTPVTVGGRFRMLGSFEYMLPLTADDMIRAVAFVDYGTVEPDVHINWDNFRVAPGFGFRITVPALGSAPLAFDFAFPICKASCRLPSASSRGTKRFSPVSSQR